MWQRLWDWIRGRTPFGAARSGRWRTVRARFLAQNPECAACGGTKGVEAHHVEPFHVRPDLELEESNLLPLCESGPGGFSCHLTVGHLGNWKRTNPNVRQNAAYFRRMLEQ